MPLRASLTRSLQYAMANMADIKTPLCALQPTPAIPPRNRVLADLPPHQFTHALMCQPLTQSHYITFDWFELPLGSSSLCTKPAVVILQGWVLHLVQGCTLSPLHPLALTLFHPYVPVVTLLPAAGPAPLPTLCSTDAVFHCFCLLSCCFLGNSLAALLLP